MAYTMTRIQANLRGMSPIQYRTHAQTAPTYFFCCYYLLPFQLTDVAH